MWPGIFLGAFAVNLTTAGSIVSSLGIASGNTLEATLGAYLVIGFANGRNVFDRAEGTRKCPSIPRGHLSMCPHRAASLFTLTSSRRFFTSRLLFKFFLLACVAATTVSASVGTASLTLTGFSRGVHWESLWLTWWLSSMAGAILVTPCFLLWSTRTEALRSRRRVVLQSAALLSLLLAGAIVFGAFLSPAAQGYPLKFICIPVVIWVAFELRPREAALAVVAFSGRRHRKRAACCAWRFYPKRIASLNGTFRLQARIIPVRPNQPAQTASNPIPPWLGEPP